MIEEATATVWKTSHGRRYLSKKSAFFAEATHRLMRKGRHAPEGVQDHFDGGGHSTTEYHTMEQRELIQRIAARYWRQFGKKRKS